MGNKTRHHRTVTRVADQQAAIVAGTDAARARLGDSFANVGARLGYGTGSQQDGSRYQLDFISRNPYNLEAAYRSNWLAGLVCDVVAEDMTRAGVHLMSDELKPDASEKIQKALERMRIWGELCNGVKWGRLYGGGIVVLLVDGQKLNTPLRLDTVAPGQFRGLVALDRWQVAPSLQNLVTEYGPDLGQPVYYDVAPSAKALINERIHYSRVIRIDGLELPFRQKLSENGWGQSVLERLWDRMVAFDSTTAGAAQLVYKAHLRTMKVKGLRSLVVAGGKMYDAFIEQMKLIRTMQSNEGLTVLDGEDEFETHAYTFAGLDDLLLQFGQQLSGATQIPLVRLFGQSPAGLNSSGESDLRTYYDGVATQQDQKLRPGIGRVLELISRSELGRPLPDGFAFEFVPLWQMTPEQKANIAKIKTDAVTAAEGSGLITPSTAAKELRQISRETGVFTHISDEDIADLENEPPMPADVAPVAEPKLAAVK
jgi:phage-related protein (TIGR01555 family)